MVIYYSVTAFSQFELLFSFIAAYTTPDGKACLTLMYTDSLIKNGFNASKDIREASKFIQGGGGGQNYLATAGGKNPDGLSEAMELLIKMATKQFR